MIGSNGEVVTAADTYIEVGKTISGFVGGTGGSSTGCEDDSGSYILNVLID